MKTNQVGFLECLAPARDDTLSLGLRGGVLGAKTKSNSARSERQAGAPFQEIYILYSTPQRKTGHFWTFLDEKGGGGVHFCQEHDSRFTGSLFPRLTVLTLLTFSPQNETFETETESNSSILHTNPQTFLRLVSFLLHSVPPKVNKSERRLVKNLSRMKKVNRSKRFGRGGCSKPNKTEQSRITFQGALYRMRRRSQLSQTGLSPIRWIRRWTFLPEPVK